MIAAFHLSCSCLEQNKLLAPIQLCLSPIPQQQNPRLSFSQIVHHVHQVDLLLQTATGLRATVSATLSYVLQEQLSVLLCIRAALKTNRLLSSYTFLVLLAFRNRSLLSVCRDSSSAMTAVLPSLPALLSVGCSAHQSFSSLYSFSNCSNTGITCNSDTIVDHVRHRNHTYALMQ
jgi:hypothetical protein